MIYEGIFSAFLSLNLDVKTPFAFKSLGEIFLGSRRQNTGDRI
jgi:hypothetical protein